MHRSVGLSTVLAAVACILVTASGCRRAPADGPPCGAVGAKFFALAKDAVAHSTLTATSSTPGDGALRRAVTDQLPAMRDSIVHACTESRWTAAVRTCLVEANDHVAFEGCEQQLTEPQRAALDRSARGASE